MLELINQLKQLNRIRALERIEYNVHPVSEVKRMAKKPRSVSYTCLNIAALSCAAFVLILIITILALVLRIAKTYDLKIL